MGQSFGIWANGNRSGFQFQCQYAQRHGIGGLQDASDAYTVLTGPFYRKRNPTIVDQIHDDRPARGNRRRDHGSWDRHQSAAAGSTGQVKPYSLPFYSIEELHHKAIAETNQRPMPNIEERVVALIEWRDGTVIDCVWQLEDVSQN